MGALNYISECLPVSAQEGLRQDPKIKRPNNATSAVADLLQLVLAGLFVVMGQTSSGRSQGFAYTAKYRVLFRCMKCSQKCLHNVGKSVVIWRV